MDPLGPLNLYLGAQYEIEQRKVDDVDIRVLQVNCEGYLKAICDDYIVLARKASGDPTLKLKEVNTPFVSEKESDAIPRQPWESGPAFTCPFCKTALPDEKGQRDRYLREF